MLASFLARPEMIPSFLNQNLGIFKSYIETPEIMFDSFYQLF